MNGFRLRSAVVGGQTPCCAKQRRRLLIGVDGLEPRAFDLVSAREGLHLTALELLFVDSTVRKVPTPQIGQVLESGFGITVHRRTRSVRLRSMRAGNGARAGSADVGKVSTSHVTGQRLSGEPLYSCRRIGEAT